MIDYPPNKSGPHLIPRWRWWWLWWRWRWRCVLALKIRKSSIHKTVEGERFAWPQDSLGFLSVAVSISRGRVALATAPLRLTFVPCSMCRSLSGYRFFQFAHLAWEGLGRRGLVHFLEPGDHQFRAPRGPLPLFGAPRWPRACDCARRSGTSRGTPATPTSPSAFRTPSSCGRLVFTSGSASPSTSSISPTMIEATFRWHTSTKPKLPWGFCCGLSAGQNSSTLSGKEVGAGSQPQCIWSAQPSWASPCCLLPF